VRGIKSGLPVHDCLRMIGTECPEPLAGEFRMLTENTGMGMTMEQALDRMYERMPTNELRFFTIVLTIQAKTGGNLAEALGNLSTVLRARKLMAEKIKALSAEAVASAFIIGSLPPGVIVMKPSAVVLAARWSANIPPWLCPQTNTFFAPLPRMPASAASTSSSPLAAVTS